MFNNVTKTCSGADATWEILTMLAGAFLLGCLLCWLIRKLRGLDSNPPTSGKESSKTYPEDISNTTRASLHNSSADSEKPSYQNHNQANQSYKAKKVGESEQSTYSTPKIDDLKKISSIDENTELLLRNKGIKSYIDLRDVDHETLTDIMNTPEFSVSKQEVETWPHQSSLAAKAEWKKLSDYQDFRNRSINTVSSQSYKPTINDSTHGQRDKLTKIAGVTPEIEETLNQHGIHSYSLLQGTNKESIKKHLVNDGINTDKLNIGSWHQQAELAEKGKWDELEEYQDFLSINSDSVYAVSSSSNKPEATNNEPTKGRQTGSVSKLQETDNLKKIEGIGVKIEEVLNKNGISTFEKLYRSNRNTLKSYLDDAGPQFKMHEPESWPHQAGMAHRGEWERLKEYQDFMVGGSDNIVSLSSTTKSINDTTTERNKANLNPKDDLTKIEGIGPKIQEVLNSYGINTYEQLHNSNRNTLKLYLDKSGPQFKMHEPESWPHQAGMAERGEWNKLAEYQDYLIIGQESSENNRSKSSMDNKEQPTGNRSASLSTSYVDDLTKIEGIGPKIEQLLNDAGVKNFEQLSNKNRDSIKTILDNGGPQFKMHEPKTWPKQAEFAYKGEWKKLEEYQDELLVKEFTNILVSRIQSNDQVIEGSSDIENTNKENDSLNYPLESYSEHLSFLYDEGIIDDVLLDRLQKIIYNKLYGSKPQTDESQESSNVIQFRSNKIEPLPQTAE
ncbi:hypothetical protein GQR58_010597 [Nymphon striatum]|nr:hypothetical protein GQR58_010597 [Nymphon striatum]